MQYHADSVAQEILSVSLERPLLKLDGVTRIPMQARLKLRVRLKLRACAPVGLDIITPSFSRSTLVPALILIGVRMFFLLDRRRVMHHSSEIEVCAPCAARVSAASGRAVRRSISRCSVYNLRPRLWWHSQMCIVRGNHMSTLC